MLLLLMFVLFCAQQAESVCEQGWTPSEDKCYIKQQTKGTFEENKLWCKSLGATMVSIHSKLQNDFIWNFIFGGEWTWIGLKHYPNASPSHVWEDGSSFDFQDGFFNNPSRSGIQGLFILKDQKWCYFELSSVRYQLCHKSRPNITAMNVEIRQLSQKLNESSENQEHLQDMLASLNNTLSDQNSDLTLIVSKMNQSLVKRNEDTAKQAKDNSASIYEMTETLNERNDRKCSLGWKHFEDNCFIESNVTLTFSETGNWCQSLNASMLRIQSFKENMFIKRTISGNSWMGGRQSLVASNDFEWIDSAPVEYSNFSAVSECNVGCGLFLDKSGQWSFDYTHLQSHRKFAVCQKMTDERVQEIRMAEKMTHREEQLEQQNQQIKESLNYSKSRFEMFSNLFICFSVVVLFLFSIFAYFLFKMNRKSIPVSHSKKERNTDIFDLN